MPPRIGENFRVGRMVGTLDGDYGTAQLRMLVPQIVGELLLGLCGSDHQNFVCAVEGVRNVIKILTIGRRFVAAVSAFAAVYALMLIVRVNHAARLFGRGEMPCRRLLVIDPNYSMIV